MRVIRVGGVEEPFNLPWVLAFEAGAFADLGIEVTYTNYAGGTGALVTALEERFLDLATVLTEGGVTAIARGSKIKLHSAYTETPLRWGVHVGPKATQTRIDDLEGKKFAISRPGSGSELMAYLLADHHEWKLKPQQFVVVGGVEGAIEALAKRKAHIFLWERFVTQPLVKQGHFKRIGELPSPWPAFYTAARPGLLETERDLVDRIVGIVLGYAAQLKGDPKAAIELIHGRYGMGRHPARSWLQGVEWPTAVAVDPSVLTLVMLRMAELDRIESPVPLTQLL